MLGWHIPNWDKISSSALPDIYDPIAPKDQNNVNVF